MTLHDFLHMSGYGPYVWSCYGLTAAVLIGIGVNARRQLQSEVVRASRRASAQSADSSMAKNPMTENPQ